MGTNQRRAIAMTDDEVAGFLDQTRTITMGTVGPDGRPHLVAMWFGLVDGRVHIETKAKSQKAVNLRRDDRITVSAEAGRSYDRLRGICIDGTATIIDDPDDPVFWAAGVSVFERYQAPYDESMRGAVELMLHNRVVVRVEPQRIRSWDHRKLGLDPMDVSGTTAAFLDR